MLPGHPCSNGTGGGSMLPTTQNAPTPESAQHQTSNATNDGYCADSLLASPRARTQTSNFEIMQTMNSILGNSLNLTSLTQENIPMGDIGNQGMIGDNDVCTPVRAVGAMRAIRGSGGYSAIHPAEPSDMTPIKQLPQLSDHLKSILARQSHGGSDFGSLISPLPASTSSASGAVATAPGYHWPPFHVYQGSEIPTYVSGLNRVDYCTLREPLTWAPLPPIAPPPQSAANHNTPAPLARNASPERSASTVSSSSSGLSMSHLNDLMTQLNLSESPSTFSHQPQRQNSCNDISRPEWSSVYQLRHAVRPSPLPMGSLSAASRTPPPVAASSASSPQLQLPLPSPNSSDYAALILAAANYFNSNSNNNNNSNTTTTNNNNNNNAGGQSISQCDPRFQPNAGDNADPNINHDQQYSIERAARIYRKAATICDATCTWSGQLPANLITRTLQNQCYSCKVFVGGVPWDITEMALLAAFGPFGSVRVEWPGKEARYAKSPVKPSAKGKGYVYMIYDNDKSVKALLENCIRDYTHNGEYYFQLTSRRLRTKEIRQVQIIPWNVGDSNHIRYPSQRLDPKKTVFVGALHGMITAEVLCNVLNDLFGGVVYAGIDTDKYKYPIGSGRVTFNNSRSYHKAIAAAFVEIKSAKFSKKVQIDPYLEDATCSNCLSAPGPYFCREFMCFRYFCKTCWHNQHALDVMQSHKPLMRNTRRSQQSQFGSSTFPISNGSQF